MRKRYWCDFSASILLEANSEEDARQEFWDFICWLQCADNNVDYVELNTIVELNTTKEESEEN